jgi:cell wall-associated NlpC family hydrolase
VASRIHLAFLAAAVGLYSAGCASTGGVPRPFPTPGPKAPAGDDARPGPRVPGPGRDNTRAPAGIDGFLVAGTALEYRGTPYRYGGSDPGSGFDCSGLVHYVYAQYGMDIPREVDAQYRTGTKIPDNKVQPGDLFFFETDGKGKGASHVAIAISSRQFVHAPSSDGVVRVEALNSTYWGRRYLGARRLLTD